MYTIGSFLREEELTGLKLMTDTADLQAEITNINIIDNPDSYDWLSSGDFLLTTGYFFRDDEAMQRQLVRELSELGCVGPPLSGCDSGGDAGGSKPVGLPAHRYPGPVSAQQDLQGGV